MKLITIFTLLPLFSFKVYAGGCKKLDPNFYDIIGCEDFKVESSWPECDRDIPVHEIEGRFYYWDQFFQAPDLPCQLEFLHLPAQVEVKRDLELCLNLPCALDSKENCHHDIVVYPYFIQNQTSAKIIAGQPKCERRRFKARGCFVKGASGRVFVANYVDFALGGE